MRQHLSFREHFRRGNAASYPDCRATDMISAEKSSNRWEACAAAKRPDGEGTRAHAVRLRSGGQQWSAVPDGGYVLRSTLGAHGDPMIKDPHLAIEEIMTASLPPGSRSIRPPTPIR